MGFRGNSSIRIDTLCTLDLSAYALDSFTFNRNPALEKPCPIGFCFKHRLQIELLDEEYDCVAVYE